MKKKMIIIGAGIAGLSAGCFAQMNGFDSEIFEMHDLPGGLCTSWNRKGYTFDGCIHWLVGANPQSILYPSWKQVGALDNKELISFEYTMIIEGDNGKKLILYCDADRLEQHLLELSPDDAIIIKEFTDAIREFGVNSQPSANLAKFMRMGRDEFVGMIKDPFLKETFSGFFGPFALIFQLGFYNRKDAVYPIGGSLEFARGIEKHYKDLGGIIHYKSKVKKIIVKDNQVTGIILENGDSHCADFIISAADGYATLFKLLGEEYLNEEIKAFYKNNKPVSSSIQVSLGIDYDLSNEPYSIQAKLNAPVMISNIERTHINFRHYCYDRTLCPAGKSVVISLIHCDYDYWEKMYQDKQAYNSEKEKIGRLVQELVENRFPEVKGKVEVVDVATPVTYNRYTDVLKGGYMGWMNTSQSIPAEVPGLKGFYMAGQWTYSLSGLPTALMTGRGSIMRICKEIGQEFMVKAD